MGGHHYQSNLIGISITGLLALTGCTYPLVLETSPGDDVTQTTHRVEIPPQELSASALEPLSRETTAAATALDFEICQDLPHWQRLPESEQMQALAELPRYGAAIGDAAFNRVIQAFWQHQVFSFTTYGLSARMEPLYFSGLWTAQDDIWNCYENGRSERINAGELAEIWLIDYRIKSLEWTGDRYIMSVEPRDSGFQLVYFPRQEQSDTLPISILNPHNTEISVQAGDW